MLHLVERLYQIPHLIPVIHHQIRLAEIIPGNLLAAVGQNHQRPYQGVGQKLCKHCRHCQHHSGKGQHSPAYAIDCRQLFQIMDVALLQRGLYKPSGVGLEIVLSLIDIIKA